MQDVGGPCFGMGWSSWAPVSWDSGSWGSGMQPKSWEPPGPGGRQAGLAEGLGMSLRGVGAGQTGLSWLHPLSGNEVRNTQAINKGLPLICLSWPQRELGSDPLPTSTPSVLHTPFFPSQTVSFPHPNHPGPHVVQREVAPLWGLPRHPPSPVTLLPAHGAPCWF